MKKITSLGIVAGVVLIGVIAGYVLYFKADDQTPPSGGGGRRGDGTGRPTPVMAATAKSGDIDVTINALGTVTARNTATVKARVDGQLIRVDFREGQMVGEGDLLAEIDPRPFHVLLDQFSGQLLRDEALLTNAKLDLERYRDLIAKDSIAKQQVDAQAALVQQYEGTVKADRAQVDNAKLQLGFTRVTAPLAGRLGLRQVDVGNMVHASDANGIVVITQTQPLNVIFAIPSDNIGAVAARLKAGEVLTADAFDRSGKKKLASGKLMTVDNQIDVTTGTVKLKAEFTNADGALFPNQFVNIGLRVETRHDAVLIPTAALQRGTQGTFVYVVGTDTTVAIRPITPGAISGDVVAVEQGLKAGEQVVVDGADKLRQGAKVEVTTPSSGGAPRKGAPVEPGGAGAAGANAGPPSERGGSPEERQKRWAEMNARIDRGEFGEEIKKLPEEERKQRMRELRRQKDGGGGSGAPSPQ
jgi:multidrug efflux system membrane fusion protein